MSVFSLPPHDSPGRQVWVSQFIHKETETEFERQIPVMQETPGREAEAEPDIRDLDHRAPADSSCPTLTSKTSTFVHNGDYLESSNHINLAHLFLTTI